MNKLLKTNTVYRINILIVLAYVFEKVDSINCAPGNENKTLENTKHNCKNNKQCLGVYQKNCTDDEDALQCLKNKASSSHVQDEGCSYRKFAIGKCFLSCFQFFNINIYEFIMDVVCLLNSHTLFSEL